MTGGFLSAFAAVLASELGDRTFIVTAILAMKHSRLPVFLGAISAAALMITISGLIGLSSSLISPALVHYLSIGTFFFFGLQMLYEGNSMDASESLGGEEDESEVLKAFPASQTNGHTTTANGFDNKLSTASSSSSPPATAATGLPLLSSSVFVSTFTMNFLAEWGDKSQVSVIVMAAKGDFLSVCTGALVGHLVANTLAVVAGAFIRDIISVRTVTLAGGVTFLSFAVLSLIAT